GFKFNTGSILKKMDILVHPSRFEGKSNTIDEAIYYGKPVVATNFDTVYEQITDGINGHIVSMDSECLYKKIVEVSENLKLSNCITKSITEEKKINKGKEFLDIIKKIGKD